MVQREAICNCNKVWRYSNRSNRYVCFTWTMWWANSSGGSRVCWPRDFCVGEGTFKACVCGDILALNLIQFYCKTLKMKTRLNSKSICTCILYRPYVPSRLIKNRRLRARTDSCCVDLLLHRHREEHAFIAEATAFLSHPSHLHVQSPLTNAFISKHVI